MTHCPICDTRVHSTHRCLGRPSPLVPMPEDFRDRFARELAKPVCRKTMQLPDPDTCTCTACRPVEPLSLWGEALPALEGQS